MKTLILLVLLSFEFGMVHAQKFMVIRSRRKHVYYKAGETIRFKLKTEKGFHKKKIVSVMDTALQFKNYRIGFREIDKVDIRGKKMGAFNWNQVGAYMQIAGIGYILIDQFNKTVVQGRAWEFESDVWITGAAIFAGGVILQLLDPKRVKIGTKYRINCLVIPTEGQKK